MRQLVSIVAALCLFALAAPRGAAAAPPRAVAVADTGGYDSAFGVAVDAAGAVYAVGYTMSPAFPTTAGALDRTLGGGFDAFVTKLAADGRTVLASTLLGGSGDEIAYGVVVDGAGSVYVCGETSSSDFPAMPGAFQGSLRGDLNGFVAKLSPDLSALSYATYLGGTSFERATDLALDAQGAAYVTGESHSNDFPTTPGAFDRTHNGSSTADAFVSKLNATGTALVYSTFLGGSADDYPAGIAVDRTGAAYVTGRTSSQNFPTTAGAFDTLFAGSPPDVFAVKLNLAGSQLSYATFLGGVGGGYPGDIAVDSANRAYVALTAEGYALGVFKLNPTGSALEYATDAAENDEDLGYPASVDVDSSGAAYLASYVLRRTSPDPSGAQYDIRVSKIAPGGGSVVYSSTYGGGYAEFAQRIAVAPGGGAVVVGRSESPDLPTSAGAYDPTYNGRTDAFVLEVASNGASLAFGTYLGGASSKGEDTPAVYAPATGAWFARNATGAGGADLAFQFGAGGDRLRPMSGDWDGDGVDTPGVFDPVTSTFFLKNSSAPGPADRVFGFGAPGYGALPISGDWDGDGDDAVGVYVPVNGAFFLDPNNEPGPAFVAFSFGPSGQSWVPLTGDWNGDGVDTCGVYDPATATFFMLDDFVGGPATRAFAFGAPNAVPVVGDWNGDAADTVGVYVPATGAWFLRDANAPGPADRVFLYGPPGLTPLAGDWDGL